MSRRDKLTKYCKLKPLDTLFNKYKIVSRLGKGRFSIVYHAVDNENRQYAVKVYRRGSSNKDYFDNELDICRSIHENRFQDGSKYVIGYVEAFAHLHLRNQNINSVHPCITYNLLGDSVRDLLEYIDSGLPIDTVKRMSRELFSGLAFLHRCGIVHCDIKTENVLLTRKIDSIQNNDQISIVIADIGSSTFTDKLFSRRIGTQEYLSPEALFMLDFGPATDVWSAMCLVYELVTGVFLFNLDEFDDALLNIEGGDEDAPDDEASDDTEISSGVSSEDSMETDIRRRDDSKEDYELCLKHLVLMESLMGPMPSKLTRHVNASRYYNRKGHLRGNPVIARTSISKMLSSEFDEISEDDCRDVEKFISCGLKYLPEERANAQAILTHPWLA